MEKVKILNINFSNYTLSRFLEIFHSRIKEGKKTFVVTANPEIVMHAKKNGDYYRTLQKADYITPDGIGILLASKILKTPIRERVTGYDLMGELLKIAEKMRWKVYLFGAKEQTLEKAYQNIKKKHPSLHIVGRHHGYVDINDPRVAQEIETLEPDITFVALGFPKQEYWIARYLDQFNKGLFLGVGGSFDVWSGEVKRAPKIWIDLHLEWFYRFLKQPWRLKRLLVLPEFLIKIILLRIKECIKNDESAAHQFRK